MQDKAARIDEFRYQSGPQCQPWQPGLTDELPDVPVLSETLLGLELLTQERCIDLQLISQLVLRDLGATLQIMRLAGREYGDAEDRPTRIEDCISDLGVYACFETVSAQTAALGGRYSAISEAWQHSLEIAHYSKLVAENEPDVNPQEAYLAGLLHAIGLLPAILNWEKRGSGPADCASAGFRMAKKWSLPPFLVEFFSEMNMDRPAATLAKIVRKAHRLADKSSFDCTFENDVRPLLHMVV